METDPFAHGGNCFVHRGELNGKPVAVKVAQQFAMPSMFGLVDVGSTQAFMEGSLGQETVREIQMHRRAHATAPCQHLIRLEAVIVDTLHGVMVPKYVLLEWASKGTVAARVASMPKPPYDFAAMCVWHTAVALAHLHAFAPPLIHRDVKADNLLICDEDTIKLADCGYMKEVRGSRMSNLRGTPGFVAPEMAHEGRQSAKVDLYSLGATFFDMMGVEVHSDDVALRRVCQAKVAELSSDEARLPLLRAMMACLSRDPSERPTAAMVVEVVCRREQTRVPRALPANEAVRAEAVRLRNAGVACFLVRVTKLPGAEGLGGRPKKDVRPPAGWRTTTSTGPLLSPGPGSNALAVRTGSATDLLVVDVDLPSFDLWWELEKQNGHVDCLRARSCSGGIHLFFSLASSVSSGLVNSRNQEHVTIYGRKTSVDVRGDGGFIFVSPTAVPEIGAYPLVGISSFHYKSGGVGSNYSSDSINIILR